MASRYSRITFQTLRVAAITYLLIVLLMTFIESWLVYPTPPKSWGDWTAVDYPHEDVQIASTDDVKLHGWLFDRSSPQHLIVYFHGNGEHVALNAKRMSELSEKLSAAVLIIDYRGYGKSEGSPTEPGVVADGKVAHKWMAKKYDVDPDQIVLMGRSLGGGVAVAVAAEQGAKALVLQNTFASMVDTAAGLYRGYP